MYAIISYRRVDGMRRKTPRIYMESLGKTPWDSWNKLFKHNSWPSKLTGNFGPRSQQIHYLKIRLEAMATRMRWEEGSEGALELVPEWAMHDGI